MTIKVYERGAIVLACVAIVLAGCGESSEPTEMADPCTDIEAQAERIMRNAPSPPPWHGSPTTSRWEEHQAKIEAHQEGIMQLTSLIVNNPDCFSTTDVLEAKRIRGWD